MFSKHKYDVFISHAVEDKLAIANDLCYRLEKAGLRIWYSGKELKVGDSIELSIRESLAQSRFAVVILSPNYLSKTWPMKEFYLLIAREIKRKVILPVLFEVTVDDLKQKDLAMADKFGIPFSKGMDHVVEKLLEEIQGKRTTPPVTGLVKKGVWMAALMALVFMASYLGYDAYTTYGGPGSELIEETITSRIDTHLAKLAKEYQVQADGWQGSAMELKEVQAAYARFVNQKSYHRNEYEFTNGYKDFQFKKNVEPALGLDLEGLSPYNAYGFSTYDVTSSAWTASSPVFSYTFVNTQPLTYRITRTRTLDDGTYEVEVTYTHNIRGVTVNLVFPGADNTKRYEVFLNGFLPVERYMFQQTGEQWTWTALE